jgi:hypothetical protein
MQDNTIFFTPALGVNGQSYTYLFQLLNERFGYKSINYVNVYLGTPGSFSYKKNNNIIANSNNNDNVNNDRDENANNNVVLNDYSLYNFSNWNSIIEHTIKQIEIAKQQNDNIPVIG